MKWKEETGLQEKEWTATENERAKNERVEIDEEIEVNPSELQNAPRCVSVRPVHVRSICL
jgi:hypothetical protein